MEEEKKKLVALKRRVSEKEVPDFYINSVTVLFSQYELLLQFGLKTNPNEEPNPVVNIRMSPEHAKVMTALLRKHVKLYEKDIGELKLLPELVKDLGIEEEI